MHTSIVILTYNKLEVTKLCIESIRTYTPEGTYEIIVIDNKSTDGTVDWLKKQKDLKTIFNKKNLGFPKGCNQGIEIASGDSILLLNNDTVVTPNWLQNLRQCLFSSPEIGAVGSVTNNCSNFQAISVPYNSIDQMIKFAEKFNVSDPGKWEDRLKLVGYCMLVKREVIDKIGFLDEIFTPGNYEDDDYSVRILESGYRLVLCKDTFIHHFGSTSFKDNPVAFNNLLIANAKKFEQKWGFSTELGEIRNDLIGLIDNMDQSEFDILHIGCGCGGTLLKVKNLYKNANIYGADPNPNALKVAKLFSQAVVFNRESREIPFVDKKFDYIMISNVLESYPHLELILQKTRTRLKPGGFLLVTLRNNVYFDCVEGNLGSDEYYLRILSKDELDRVLSETGFTSFKINTIQGNAAWENREFIGELIKLNPKYSVEQYCTANYLIKAEVNSTFSGDAIDEIAATLPVKKHIRHDASSNLPRVSILIPTYKHSRLFDIALESALKQTYPNIEIIICDDSTNNDIKKVVARYQDNYKNIRYYKNKKNLGQFDNDIKLFELAEGEYVNYLMDDDVFHPEKIEKMMNYFLSDTLGEIKLVTSSRKMIDEEGKEHPHSRLTMRLFPEDAVLDGKNFGNFILRYNLNCIGEPTTVLFRKKDLNEPFGVFCGRRYGCNVDMATWLNLIADGKAVYISEPLSYFRIHSSQQLNSTKMKVLGACDYAHEILNAPQRGFFENNTEYKQVLGLVIYYVGGVLKEVKENGPYKENIKEARGLLEVLYETYQRLNI